MITIGMNYQVIEGKNQAFEERCKVVIKSLESAEGHKRSNLYNDVQDRASYLIVSEWDDSDAFDTFIKSEAFRKVTSWGSDKILSGRPSHTRYGA